MARHGLSGSLVGLAVGLALTGIATAQVDAQPADAGVITGEVARCVNGAEQPAAQVSVGVEGGSASLVRTDSNGEFLLALAPGQYTVVATANDGTASRQYVPVESGQVLDIGVLDVGGGVAGCGPDSDITAPVLPTFTPTSTPLPATATPTPSPQATSTPTPEAGMDTPPDPDPGA